MNQVVLPSTTGRRRRPRLHHLLWIAGLAQIAAAFAPAARVRLLSDISFVRLPNTGVAFSCLVFSPLREQQFCRARLGRSIPGLVSLGLLFVMYAKLRYAPWGGFFDPMLRRAVRPAWGFVPMSIAALFLLVAAATIRRERMPRGDSTGEALSWRRSSQRSNHMGQASKEHHLPLV